MDSTHVGFDALPVDVLGRVLEFLGAAQLHHVEQTSKLLRRTVVEQGLWSRLCLAGCYNLQPYITNIRAEAAAVELQARRCNPSPEELRSAFFKRLCWRLGTPVPPAHPSLLACALTATSTRQPKEQLDNVLRQPPAGQQDGAAQAGYWASAGRREAGAVERLSFRLSHPLALVHSVEVTCCGDGVRAYPPCGLRLRVGGTSCFRPNGVPRSQRSITCRLGAASATCGGGRAGPDGAAPPRLCSEVFVGVGWGGAYMSGVFVFGGVGTMEREPDGATILLHIQLFITI